jgi:hypothetical protein
MCRVFVHPEIVVFSRQAMATLSLPGNFYYKDLSSAKTGIRMAWILCLLSGGLTLAVTLAAMDSPQVALQTGLSAWNLIDVVLILGLAVGIFLKNRACAVLLLTYCLISKVIQIASGLASPSAIGIGILCAHAFFNGVRGTFTYHKLKQTAA